MWKVYSADVHIYNIVAMEIAWKQAPFICKAKCLFLLHQTTFIVMHIYTNIRTHTDNTEIQIRPPFLLVCSSELNVDNWNDNCEAKSEAKSPRPLRGLQVDFSLTRNVSYAVR